MFVTETKETVYVMQIFGNPEEYYKAEEYLYKNRYKKTGFAWIVEEEKTTFEMTGEKRNPPDGKYEVIMLSEEV